MLGKLLLSLLVSFGLFMFGCDEDSCPNCPDKQDESFTFVASAYNPSNPTFPYLLTVEYPSFSIKDSTEMPFLYRDFRVSSDSLHIIGGQNPFSSGFYLIIYEIDSKVPVDTIYFTSPIHDMFIDAVDNLLIIATGTKVYTFSASNFTLLDSIPIGYEICQIDENSNLIYGNNIEEGHEYIYCYNFVSGNFIDSFRVVDTANNGIVMYDLYPVSDESKIYILGLYQGSNICVYDLNLRKFEKLFTIASPFGRVYRNGNDIFVTDPGREFFGEPGSYKIYQIDVQTSVLENEYSTIHDNVTLDVQRLRFTPQNNFFAFGEHFTGSFLYNIDTDTIINVENELSSFTVYDIEVIKQ